MSVTRRGAGCGGQARGRRPRVRHRFKTRPIQPPLESRWRRVHREMAEQTCKAPRAERRVIGGPW
jgi:hypothetical protein